MKKSKSSKSKSENGAANKPECEDFLIVGIGAAAGGIQALKSFFGNVPADSGAAYVVILHLSPEHESHLAEVLQTNARISVTQVNERVKVEPNHVFVVPPNQSLAMADGHIVVSPINTIEERRAPVDIFFRTLAEAHHEKAVCVVLSGTGADGSMGLKRVKENGGVVFVQNPREAEYNDMVRNAIATNLVDEVLNVAEIPAKIVEYRENRKAVALPVEPEAQPEEQQKALRDIFTQLRVRTGHDFTNYKRPTILRRIERRISVRSLSGIAEYAAYLKKQPEEVQALLKDLLISVTNFFRDKQAFAVLENDVIPRLVHEKRAGEQIRVWVAGCATGEEAYSIAMLLAEQVDGGGIDAPEIQIFASDIDEAAIATAREGFYTINDAADVSPERLRRFFTKEGDGYRVRRDLRERVLFASHNVLKDPPFSRLKLVTCRNMLIYLNPAAQKRVMETFHFALLPNSFLFLGASESIDGSIDAFAPVSKENNIFQSRNVESRIPRPVRDLAHGGAAYNTTFKQTKSISRTPESEDGRTSGRKQQQDSAQHNQAQERLSYADLHQQLLEQFAPPSVVVNENYDILHLSERAGRFMQIQGGEPSNNLLKIIRPELRIDLRNALYQAAQKRLNVEAKNLTVKIDDRSETINIHVRPVIRDEDTARGFILVLFEKTDDAPTGDAETVIEVSAPAAEQLEEELMRVKAQFRSSNEQHELQTEELRASNEELQALNEELRSSGEELQTVNQELKVKIEEISLTSNNLQNLVNSTDIATIFLDRNFSVQLFTPVAREIFNLIPSDFGRPLTDITNRLADDNLLHDAETVLEKLHTIERGVRTVDNRFFTMRVMPYRTADDRIRGTVITFYDITERKRAEEARFHLAAIVESSEDSMLTIDFGGTITSWNKAAEQLYGYPASETIGKPLTMLTLPEDLAQVLRNIDKIKHSRQVEIFDSVRVNKDGREMNLEVVLSPVKDSSGAVIGISTIARDVTERRRAEEALRQSEKTFSTLIENAPFGVYLIDGKFRLRTVNEGSRNVFGGIEPLIGRDFAEILRIIWEEPFATEAIEKFRHTLKTGESFISPPIVKQRANIEDIESYDWQIHRIVLTDGSYGVVCYFYDLSEQKRLEETVRRSAEVVRASETRFRAIVNQATAAIAEYDLAGNFTLVNDTLCDLLGYTEAEFLQMNLHDITHPEDLPLCLEAFAQAIAIGKASVSEKRVFRKDSSTVWVTESISSIADADGEPRRVAMIAFDISQRKEIEEALRTSSERLRLLIESTSDYAIFTTTLDNRIDSWNTGAEKIFGWTEREAVGQTGEIIFTPEDREKGESEKEIATARQTGRAPDERFHLKKDGSRFYVSGVTSLLRDASGNAHGFVKIARDMTERIEAEKTVREKELLQKLVGAQEDERKRIARDLHDELGQLLTGLRLKLESVKKLCKDEELCGKIDDAQGIAKHLDEGIDFLAWELRPAALDDLGLRAALEKYVREWSHFSGVTAELLGSGIKKARLAPEVETNFYRIAQEALNNVHKHAKANSVEIVFDRRGDSIVLIIEDDGKGFKPESKTTRGKGIGLIGMRERAALVGGSLEIESAPGKGTTVHVRVPASNVK